jgi:hypothetical protein
MLLQYKSGKKKDYFEGCTLSKGKTVHATVVVEPAVIAQDIVKRIVRFFGT